MSDEEANKKDEKQIEIVMTTVLLAASLIGSKLFDEKDMSDRVISCHNAAKTIIKLANA